MVVKPPLRFACDALFGLQCERRDRSSRENASLKRRWEAHFPQVRIVIPANKRESSVKRVFMQWNVQTARGFIHRVFKQWFARPMSFHETALRRCVLKIL